MKEKFQNKIDRIIKLMVDISSKGKNHVSKFNNTGFNDLDKIIGILILERIVGNLNSSRILLSELINNPNVEPAIGLILRNNLSLCKIVFKHSEVKNTQSDLDKFYKTVFGENIQKSIKYIRKHHSSEELQPFLDSIKGKYAFILKEADVDIDNIENEKFDPNINLTKKFESLENLFIAYSKYEHFGLNTLILQENNEIEILERIEIAVHYSLQGILICLLMLQIVDEELINKNIEISNNNLIKFE